MEGTNAEEDGLLGDINSVYNYIVLASRISLTFTGERFFLKAFRAFYDVAALSKPSELEKLLPQSATSSDNIEKLLSVRKNFEGLILHSLPFNTNGIN